eukprot:CAMPEP_0197174636 /NCGR_PEP_ID=MMETSP1423-20130617/1064_1 /TAXON_ID=476441 /ORGANISM="Pseudo-nitzschia heimii, Strain UNC1101" /LENGTH=1412 /DNA_ID=CAMNT_0042623579 /DNA_START=113 /DNA_END=4348 /DNA_ORIENTATION=-
MFRGGRRNANSNGIVNNSTNADSTPLEELTLLLDKLESLVDKSMGTFLDVLISQTTSNDGKGNINNERGNGILKSIRHRFRKGQRLPEESSSSSLKSDECQTEEEQSSESSKTGEKDKVEKKKFDFRRKRKQPNAQFVPMNQTDLASFVEIVRRLSELVVIGESAAANVQSEEAKLRSLIMHQQSTTREEEINIKSDDTSDAHKFAEEERKLKEDLMKEHCESIREKISEKKEFASVYEYFFQRNGLATIGDILSGKVFNLSNFVEKRKKVLQTELEELNDKQKKRSSKEEPDDKDNRADEEMNNRAKAREDKNSRADKEKHNRATEKLNSLETISQMEDFANIVLLPPLAVATQGFQSTSILVQNVKRATSLFFLLSNNHINELIDFPLEGYHIAERNKLEGRSDRNGLILINSSNPSNLMSPRRFGSAELSELTTTFVTFLKSLALRMNGETLQFFLTYPADTTIEGDIDYFEEVVDNTNDHDDEERPLDEIAPNAKTKGEIAVNRPIAVKTIKVEFPLYERALEFCSAQNDSFVRVTAMNICLNTLRLTTVEATTDDEEPGDVAKTVELEAALGASPNAVLHNAKALPLRERLAIAQYVCTPSRVEKLASPLFTKLAQLWGELEEEFRDMEMATKVGQVDKNTEKDEDKQKNLRRKQNEKLARAREIARRKKFTKIFNDTSYNIQDELLLLEDMLKVGLTSLNEQVIEMMFATFVYPLLLQPLLLYFQRSPVAAEVLFADALSDHSSGSDIKQSDATATEKAIISAPAKSALFCLAAVFKFLTNPPLLRLLFTSVFHPLSPTTSGETMIRAKADVACMGKNGKATLRIDRVDERGKLIIDDDRETYVFGTVTGRKEISGRNSESGKNDLNDACVFVLSPALSEILQFSGQDGGLVAKSRHNPYRKAIFQCFKLNKEVSDLQDLAVMAVDSAVSVFDEKFLADLLFGLDIKRYKDNLSTDNRFDSFRGDNPNIDSNFEDDLDDRGMGGSISASVDPRLSLGEVKGGKLGFDYMDEVINAFKCCIMSVGPGGKGAWKLNYDMVAANALLHSIRGKPEAVKCASKAMESRFCEAAAFLADVPATIDTIFDSGRLWSELKNLVPVNGDESDKNNLYYGAIMDMIIRRNKGDGFADVGSILDHMLYLTKDVKNKDEDVAIFVSVSSAGSYDAVGARACGVAPLEQDAAGAAFGNAVGSTSALLKLNSFASLLDGLLSFEDMMRYVKVGGFIFKRSTGQHIPNPDDEMTIFSPITPAFDNALFGGNENIDSASLSADAMPGSVIKLPGKMVFPCVCEVPSSMAPLFSKDAAKVVSLGITWQSLYLVIEDEQMILVEPDRHSNGKGRVVTVCRLENLTLNADSNVRVDTSARRLVLICESPDLKPPGLFRFDKKLELKRKGPFSHVKRWKSSLDIW